MTSESGPRIPVAMNSASGTISSGTARCATARLVWYLVGRPGILRRVFPAWCAYFLPGFHPWKRDDRALIGKYDSDYAAAAMR